MTTAATVTPGVRRRWIAVDCPAWAQAHASTITVSGGRRVAAWFAGTHEGTPDNRIWVAATANGEWSAPRIVADSPVAHWNPVLAVGPDDALWLFFKRGARISEWQTWVVTSVDHGDNWSEAVPLVDDDRRPRGPVKNPPLLLADGTWLAPGSVEEWSPLVAWSAFVDRSTDKGKTWTVQEIPLDRTGFQGAGVIQPALWHADDRVFALARSTEGVAYRSWSDDAGRTWSPMQPTSLANNNSGLAVVSIGSDLVACVHNPVSGDWGHRCPLVISLSADRGESWTRAVTIEDGRTLVDDAPLLLPSAGQGSGFAPADRGVWTDGVGEYSYPSAVVDGDELIVTYTWQRRGIVEARVPLELLTRAISRMSSEETEK